MDTTTDVARREFFYIGGEYIGEDGQTTMRGQSFVEVIFPSRILKAYPLVFVHGTAQTCTCWLGTPDGRVGWANYFVKQGYVVYLLEQPMRGRSAWHPEDGPTRMFTTQEIEHLFTATSELGEWPQAKRHTQWPGSGRKGDPVFDAFYSSQVESLTSSPHSEKALQHAGVALLDKIGPAIIVTHSQGAYFNWLVTDKRPKLVKGSIAIEPAGPPCENLIFGTGPNRSWGLTNIQLTYEPPLLRDSDLQIERSILTDKINRAPCWQQIDPARELPNLKGVPTLILVAEASYHAMFAHCTAKWLEQAGVTVELLRLESKGILGNGHMMMLELNNLNVAALLDDWINTNVPGSIASDGFIL